MTLQLPPPPSPLASFLAPASHPESLFVAGGDGGVAAAAVAATRAGFFGSAGSSVHHLKRNSSIVVNHVLLGEMGTQTSKTTIVACSEDRVLHFPGESVDDELVGDHHDGRVGDLPAELGDHAAVEAAPPLLAVHQEDRLPELVVARVALAEARPGHLCKTEKGRYQI